MKNLLVRAERVVDSVEFGESGEVIAEFGELVPREVVVEFFKRFRFEESVLEISLVRNGCIYSRPLRYRDGKMAQNDFDWLKHRLKFYEAH